MLDSTAMLDEVTTVLDRPRGAADAVGLSGRVLVEIRNPAGELTFSREFRNLITSVGDQLYASRGAGLTTSALPLGMKLGTGSTAVAKTGAGAALVTYLTNSHQVFDGGFPTVVAGVATYKVTYAAGKATSASTAITEAVIYTDATADATSTAANTIARVLISGVPSKQAGDSLAITWVQTALGS